MKTSIWVTDLVLQQVFDQERDKISQSTHPLAANYSTWFDKNEIIAYTMSHDGNNVFLCSTIGRKSHWPIGVYRILNRLFKGEPVDIVTKHIGHVWMDHVEEQIKFLQSVPGFRTAIISRKQGYKRTLRKFQLELLERNLQFTIASNPIWVCNDYHNPECLQDILYYGEDCLNEFKIV
jgi:hypothetical protein